MLFEIVNDLFENFLISYFISSYLKLEKKNKIFFLLITIPINTFISAFLSNFNIIGFSQTLLIQIVLWLSLFTFNKEFSTQDIMISLFCNILLVIAVYFSILTFSFIFHITPAKVFSTNTIYYPELIFSRIVFITLLLITLKKRPLLLTKTQNTKTNYLLTFELLFILLMIYYFTSNVLFSDTFSSANVIFICFVMLFLSFCFIFNQMVKMNKVIYENKLKKQHENYTKENLKNIKAIKFEIENISHRMNYILQSIEFDLYEQNYDDAISKIESYKNTVSSVSNVICTHNELFDFMLNFEIKFFHQQNKQLKICSFVSQNQSYNNLELINKITDSLKYFYSYVNEIELFLTEQDNFLEVKFIIPTNDFVQKEIIDNLSEINIPNISIKNLNNLLVILYKEKLTSYD